MRDNVCAGDDLIMTGKVVRRYEEAGDHRVDVEIVIATQAGPVRTYDTDGQQAYGTRERSKGRKTKTRPAVALLLTLLSIGAVLVPQGCATRGSPADAAAQDQEFMGWLQNVSHAAKADPKYKNLSIDSPQQIQSFMVRTHDAYRRKISVEEYTRWLNASYPGHEYEVSFITQRLPH